MTAAKNSKKWRFGFRVRCLQPLSHPSTRLFATTVGVKRRSPTLPPDDRESLWQKTPYANLVRYSLSRKYFARIRVGGKLIRQSLKTKVLSVAKLKLADLEKGTGQTRRRSAFDRGDSGVPGFGERISGTARWNSQPQTANKGVLQGTP